MTCERPVFLVLVESSTIHFFCASWETLSLGVFSAGWLKKPNTTEPGSIACPCFSSPSCCLIIGAYSSSSQCGHVADGHCVPCIVAVSVPGIAGFACGLPGSQGAVAWAQRALAGVLCGAAGHSIPRGGLTSGLDCALLLVMLCKCQSWECEDTAVRARGSLMKNDPI